MNRWILNSLGIALIASLGLAVWGGFALNKHLITTVDQFGDAARGATVTEATLNRPKTGTLAEVDKTLLATKSILVHGDLVIAHEDRQLGKYDGYIKGISSEISHATSGIYTATGKLETTADSATQAINTANKTIAGLQPIEIQLKDNGSSLQAATDALNMRLRDPHVDNLMAHLDEISGTGESMLDTANQVETKATKSYLHPSKNPFIRTWNAAEPWLNIGAQGIVKFGPVLH